MTEDLCSRFGLFQEVCAFGVIYMLPKDEKLMAHANSNNKPSGLRRVNIDFKVPQGTSFSHKLIEAFEIMPDFLRMGILSPSNNKQKVQASALKN